MRRQYSINKSSKPLHGKFKIINLTGELVDVSFSYYASVIKRFYDHCLANTCNYIQCHCQYSHEIGRRENKNFCIKCRWNQRIYSKSFCRDWHHFIWYYLDSLYLCAVQNELKYCLSSDDCDRLFDRYHLFSFLLERSRPHATNHWHGTGRRGTLADCEMTFYLSSKYIQSHYRIDSPKQYYPK